MCILTEKHTEKLEAEELSSLNAHGLFFFLFTLDWSMSQSRNNSVSLVIGLSLNIEENIQTRDVWQFCCECQVTSIYTEQC